VRKSKLRAPTFTAFIFPLIRGPYRGLTDRVFLADRDSDIESAAASLFPFRDAESRMLINFVRAGR